MEIITDAVVTNPQLWLDVAATKGRVGLTDLHSIQEEKALAASIAASGQTVTFDAKDALVPFRVERFFDISRYASGLYSTLFVAQLKHENPDGQDRWIIARRAKQEDLLLEIYRDCSHELFANGVGDRVDLAEITTDFFEGLHQDSPPPLTGYSYAKFLRKFDQVDINGNVLEFAKFIELSGKVASKAFTLALYQAVAQNNYASRVAIWELGAFDRGGSIVWLVGEPAGSVDVVVLHDSTT